MKSIASLNEKIKEITEEQKILKEEIEDKSRDKLELIEETLRENVDEVKVNDVDTILEKLRNIITEQNDYEGLTFKMGSLIKKSFKRLTAKRIETDMHFPDNDSNGSRYWFGRDRKIYVNLRGICYMPRYYDRAVYIDKSEELIYCLQNIKGLHKWVTKNDKKEILKIYEKHLNKFKLNEANRNKPLIVLDANIKYPLYGSGYNDIGVESITFKTYKYLILTYEYRGVKLKLTNDVSNYYWSSEDLNLHDITNDVDTSYALSQLKDDKVRELDKKMDTLISDMGKNVKVYDDIKDKILPYIVTEEL